MSRIAYSVKGNSLSVLPYKIGDILGRSLRIVNMDVAFLSYTPRCTRWLIGYAEKRSDASEVDVTNALGSGPVNLDRAEGRQTADDRTPHALELIHFPQESLAGGDVLCGDECKRVSSRSSSDMHTKQCFGELLL